MSSHVMVSQQELRPEIPKSVLKPGAVENGSQTLVSAVHISYPSSLCLEARSLICNLIDSTAGSRVVQAGSDLRHAIYRV